MTYESIDLEVVKKLLTHDPILGKLYWKTRTPEYFEKSRYPNQACAIWNGHYAGKEAIFGIDGGGYRKGSVLRKQLKAHRVIWALEKGAWPAAQLDHINGTRTDNRIENLREVSHSENCQNSRIRSDNKTGVVGVNWCKRTGNWQASIQTEYIGRFDTFEAAVVARKTREMELGFHPNHGSNDRAVYVKP